MKTINMNVFTDFSHPELTKNYVPIVLFPISTPPQGQEWYILMREDKSIYIREKEMSCESVAGVNT